jgi:peptide/nickel transport system permease protein
VLSYAGRRIVLLVPVLLGATVVVFALIHLIPGDPAGALLGPNSSEASRAALRHELGLDQALPIQYAKWLWLVLHLDLGTSIARRQPVASIVWDAFQHTLVLAAMAALLANVVGLFLGIIAATRQFGLADRAAMAVAAFGTAIPSYWLGLILVVGLALKVQIFPTGGMISAIDGGSPTDVLWHLVLPAVAAGAAPAGIVARTVRASVLEVLRLDFVQALRARGLSERTILYRHIVPNALPAILTVMGLQAGYLLGGVAFVEVVFSWPGIGNLLFLSIGQRDYPVILGVMLFVSVAFVVLNLAVDLMHAALDPRVRTSVTG